MGWAQNGPTAFFLVYLGLLFTEAVSHSLIDSPGLEREHARGPELAHSLFRSSGKRPPKLQGSRAFEVLEDVNVLEDRNVTGDRNATEERHFPNQSVLGVTWLAFGLTELLIIFLGVVTTGSCQWSKNWVVPTCFGFGWATLLFLSALWAAVFKAWWATFLLSPPITYLLFYLSTWGFRQANAGPVLMANLKGTSRCLFEAAKGNPKGHSSCCCLKRLTRHIFQTCGPQPSPPPPRQQPPPPVPGSPCIQTRPGASNRSVKFRTVDTSNASNCDSLIPGGARGLLEVPDAVDTPSFQSAVSANVAFDLPTNGINGIEVVSEGTTSESPQRHPGHLAAQVQKAEDPIYGIPAIFSSDSSDSSPTSPSSLPDLQLVRDGWHHKASPISTELKTALSDASSDYHSPEGGSPSEAPGIPIMPSSSMAKVASWLQSYTISSTDCPSDSVLQEPLPAAKTEIVVEGFDNLLASETNGRQSVGHVGKDTPICRDTSGSSILEKHSNSGDPTPRREIKVFVDPHNIFNKNEPKGKRSNPYRCISEAINDCVTQGVTDVIVVLLPGTYGRSFLAINTTSNIQRIQLIGNGVQGSVVFQDKSSASELLSYSGPGVLEIHNVTFRGSWLKSRSLVANCTGLRMVGCDCWFVDVIANSTKWPCNTELWPCAGENWRSDIEKSYPIMARSWPLHTNHDVVSHNYSFGWRHTTFCKAMAWSSCLFMMLLATILLLVVLMPDDVSWDEGIQWVERWCVIAGLTFAVHCLLGGG